MSRLEQLMGYTFQNRALLEQALTHRSAHRHHNERLEFLGDAVLNWTITKWLYHRFAKASEGQLTRLRASLVNRDALAAIAKVLDLKTHIIVGLGEQKSGDHLRDSILADAVEAILGAIVLDDGHDTAEYMIMRWWLPRLKDLTMETATKDPKTRLQEWLQARGAPVPDYRVIRQEGPAHAQRFTVEGHVNCLEAPLSATARSKRLAEQMVAQAILKVLHETV